MKERKRREKKRILSFCLRGERERERERETPVVQQRQKRHAPPSKRCTSVTYHTSHYEVAGYHHTYRAQASQKPTSCVCAMYVRSITAYGTPYCIVLRRSVVRCRYWSRVAVGPPLSFSVRSRLYHRCGACGRDTREHWIDLPALARRCISSSAIVNTS